MNVIEVMKKKWLESILSLFFLTHTFFVFPQANIEEHVKLLTGDTMCKKNVFYQVSFTTFALVPNRSNIYYHHEKQFVDDIYYDLKITPKATLFNPFFNFQINFRLTKWRDYQKKIFLSIGLNYFIIKYKNNQYGYYEGGVANYYFNGTIIENIKYDFVAPSLGVFFLKKISSKIHFDISTSLLYNWNILTAKKHYEINNYNYPGFDYEIRTINRPNSSSLSVGGNFRFGVVYKVKEIGCGIFANISFSEYLILNKSFALNDLSFLKYYNCQGIGVSINF